MEKGRIDHKQRLNGFEDVGGQFPPGVGEVGFHRGEVIMLDELRDRQRDIIENLWKLGDYL